MIRSLPSGRAQFFVAAVLANGLAACIAVLSVNPVN
jgi:hypothetical protein